MSISDYLKILNEHNLHIHSDGIIYKHGTGNQNRPICNNDVLQDLATKKQSKTISEEENELLGNCILTLIKIVLNNKTFRFQTEDIKEDIISESTFDVLSALDRGLYDPTKGKAYSYIFRLCYVAGIHVLRDRNIAKEITDKLILSFNELYPEDLILETESTTYPVYG